MSVAAITIMLRRSKAKLKAANRAEGIIPMESMHDTTTGPLPSVSATNTQNNAAYGYTQT